MTSPTKVKASTLNESDRKQIIEALRTSYNMEIETVVNYLANSIHLDGLLAMEVKESLEEDIQEELGHARKLAARIKVLGGAIPGSMELKMSQKTMQPPDDTIDVESVIRGVIDAEEGAIDQYQKIIEMTGDEKDPVTQDLCIALKGDEEEHRREFVGFMREYDRFKDALSKGKPA